MTRWHYQSLTGFGTYTVTQAPTGLLTCNCKAFVLAQHRDCSHIKQAIAEQELTVEWRNGYVFGWPLTSASNDAIIIEKGDEMATMTATATILTPMKASAMVEGKFAHLVDGRGFIVGAKFDAAFPASDWTMEGKLDGHRCLVRKQGLSIETPLRSVTLPAHIVREIQRLPDGIYDGELLVPGGVSTDVPNLALRDSLMYAVFDVLEVDGQSTLSMLHKDRRAVLEMCMQFAPGQNAVVLMAQYEPSWAMVKSIWANGGEGVILKRKVSLYRPGARSADWLKVKKLEQHTVTITGFEAGSLGPSAVTLFKFDDGTVGRCKTQSDESLNAATADPSDYVGRRLVLQCQQRMRGSRSPRHPMWDHLAGEGE